MNEKRDTPDWASMSRHVTHLSYLASPTLWLHNMNSCLVDAPLSNLVSLILPHSPFHLWMRWRTPPPSWRWPRWICRRGRCGSGSDRSCPRGLHPSECPTNQPRKKNVIRNTESDPFYNTKASKSVGRQFHNMFHWIRSFLVLSLGQKLVLSAKKGLDTIFQLCCFHCIRGRLNELKKGLFSAPKLKDLLHTRPNWSWKQDLFKLM